MAETAPNQETLEQVKRVIRRDLKLGPDEPIADDMPLIGGELDLDSLDVLMLLTSLEKRFGIKVADREVGRAIFESVSTLAAYVEQHGGGDGAGGKVGGAVDLDAALARLPHGAAFRFVSRLTQLRPGQEGKGVWELSGDEPFFAGHFPSRPVVPGVLIGEALAQLCGLVAAPAEGNGEMEGRLAAVDLRFREEVRPPVQVELIGRPEKAIGALHRFVAEARVEGRTVADGTLALHVSTRQEGDL